MHQDSKQDGEKGKAARTSHGGCLEGTEAGAMGQPPKTHTVADCTLLTFSMPVYEFLCYMVLC
jgi:hypothetical protein